MKNREQFGFSLIELLLAVAVILIIAAIAIPQYLSSKMAANEAATVGSMRSISSALIMYSTAYPLAGYPASLSELADGGSPSNCLPSHTPTATGACMIDPTVGTGIKSGYMFTYSPVGSAPASGYNLNADPLARGATGRRSFFTDVPGVIHWNASTAATSNDPSIPM